MIANTLLIAQLILSATESVPLDSAENTVHNKYACGDPSILVEAGLDPSRVFTSDGLLPDDPDLPVAGIVSRLVDQKGFDLLAAIAAELENLPLQRPPHGPLCDC